MIYLFLLPFITGIHLITCFTGYYEERYAKEHEFPFVASIQANYSEHYVHVCSGTILNELHLLTNAHCLGYFVRKSIPISLYSNGIGKVVAGSRFNINGEPERGYQERFINRRKLHPYCRAESWGFWKYDFGLIEVDRPFTFSQSLRPAPFYLNEDTLLYEYKKLNYGKNCFVLGWRKNTLNAKIDDEYISIILRAVPVRRIRKANCDAIFCSKGNCDLEAKQNSICALSIGSNTGVCLGDNGGPIVCNGKVWGISAWSAPCFSYAAPSIFTYIYLAKELYNCQHDPSNGVVYKCLQQ